MESSGLSCYFLARRAVLAVVVVDFEGFASFRALFGNGGVKGLCKPLSMWYCLRLFCAVAKLKSSLFVDDGGDPACLGQDLFFVTGESFRGEEVGGS